MSNRSFPHRDVNGYQPPMGPKNITDPKSPGLHGNNFECEGTQGPKDYSCESSGSPGLGGVNHSCGSQGCR
jgi:hypothetical protein